MPFQLSAPRTITLVISVVIAMIAVIIHFGHIPIQHIHSGFSILLVGYLVLIAGNVLSGV